MELPFKGVIWWADYPATFSLSVLLRCRSAAEFPERLIIEENRERWTAFFPYY
jgi:hypothetical protein